MVIKNIDPESIHLQTIFVMTLYFYFYLNISLHYSEYIM